MTRNLEPGLEPQAHVRVRMYRYSGATDLCVSSFIHSDAVISHPSPPTASDASTIHTTLISDTNKKDDYLFAFTCLRMTHQVNLNGAI
jgi:hypothetical protein